LAQPELVEKFSAAGGDFVTPVAQLTQKLEQCRAIVFDWDGVFNAGRKDHSSSSGFSEADSMGTNMLRYGFWRRLGELPYTAIISGENNESAIAFAEREHLTAVYTGIRSKQHVIEHLCGEHDLQPAQIACVFDDINDLPMAEVCGIRFMVRRSARGAYPVREICELLLGLMDVFDDVVASRGARDAEYEGYFKIRQAAATRLYRQDDDEIVLRD
jgi:3-deoxy-D-manno-octulosonate 8-phosphate phosphatase (KDO 8-P phosphatase)